MVSPLIGGAGATAILQGLLTPKKPGQFIPKNNAITNLQKTLGGADFQAGQRQIFQTALNRLEGVRQGIIDPNPDQEWETLGSFFAATGQPFQLFLNEQGQLTAEAQATGELAGFSQAQKQGIYNAIDQFDEIAEQVDFENQKTRLLNKYVEGAVKLSQLENYFPAEDRWELDFEHFRELGVPVQVGVNANGELTAINQLDHDFAEVENEGDRLKLLAARDELANILAGRGSATKDWHFKALGNKVEDDDYLIGLDKNGDIEIRRNLHRDTPTSAKTLNHLIPDFLKEENEIEFDRPWKEQAANLYRQGKPFYFDYDNSGRNLIARELDLIHAMGLHKPVDRSAQIIEAQISLIA